MQTVMKIASVMLAFSLTACQTEEEGKGNDEVKYPVVTHQPTPVSHHDKVYATGRLAYEDEYKLSFKTGGIVETIPVHEGEKVEEGEMLAALKLDEIQAKKEQAENVFEKAKRDFDRIQGLYNDSVATLEQLQDATTQLENARLDLEAARFNLRHSRIIAPGNGIIQKINARENEAIQPGVPVIMFGALNSVKVLSTNLSDVDVVRIDMGDTARVHFDPFPDQPFQAIVSEISGMADPLTGTYEVKIRLIDKDDLLKSGFIGNINIHSSRKQNLLSIPVDALVQGNGKTGYVYLKKGNQAILKEIRIYDITEENILVSRGLSENDKIITEGQYRLSGDTVVIN